MKPRSWMWAVIGYAIDDTGRTIRLVVVLAALAGSVWIISH